MKLQLLVDVEYDLGELSPGDCSEVLKNNLKEVAYRGFREGCFTGGSSAEIKTFSVLVQMPKE